MSDKKKVYVETTVVSDATALPTNDLSLAGRQIVTREWWNKAPEHFDLFVSPVVQREDTLEEMWRIKRELSTQQGSWAEYAASLMAFQEEDRRAGARYYAPASCKAKV